MDFIFLMIWLSNTQIGQMLQTHSPSLPTILRQFCCLSTKKTQLAGISLPPPQHITRLFSQIHQVLLVLWPMEGRLHRSDTEERRDNVHCKGYPAVTIMLGIQKGLPVFSAANWNTP